MSNLGDYTDLTVETPFPEWRLDEIVQQLPMGPAVVIAGSYVNGRCVIRTFGNPKFMAFALVNQGYGKVIDPPEET